MVALRTLYHPAQRFILGFGHIAMKSLHFLQLHRHLDSFDHSACSFYSQRRRHADGGQFLVFFRQLLIITVAYHLIGMLCEECRNFSIVFVYLGHLVEYPGQILINLSNELCRTSLHRSNVFSLYHRGYF